MEVLICNFFFPEHKVAIKILDNLISNWEEAESEYGVLKELSLHPNLPFFHGLYYSASSQQLENAQLWFVMEVSLARSYACVETIFW